MKTPATPRRAALLRVGRAASELTTVISHWPALRALQLTIRGDSAVVDPQAWRRATGLLRELRLGRRSVRLFWLGCNGKAERLMARVENELLKRRPERARTILLSSPHSPLNASSASCLAESFSALAGTDNNHWIQPEPPERRSSLPKLVLVSGMSWSGSSAIFDYLREFKNVVPIEAEIPHLSRGAANLSILRQAIDDAVAFRRLAIDFFFGYLLGFSRIESDSDVRIRRFGRERALAAYNADYIGALNVFALFVDAICRSAEPTVRRTYFHHLVDHVMAELVVGRSLAPGQVVVLNNAIKIGNLPSAEILSSSIVLCSFRDPRAQFVAMRQESIAFIDSAQEWAEKASLSLERSHRLADTYASRRANPVVIKVQFEDFVLSESYREAIASAAGLQADHHIASQYFRAEESRRNVDIYRAYPEQSEIEHIADVLGRYCRFVGVHQTATVGTRAPKRSKRS